MSTEYADSFSTYLNAIRRLDAPRIGDDPRVRILRVLSHESRPVPLLSLIRASGTRNIEEALIAVDRLQDMRLIERVDVDEQATYRITRSGESVIEPSE